MQRTALTTALSLAAFAFVAAPLAYAGPPSGQATPPIHTGYYNANHGFGGHPGSGYVTGTGLTPIIGWIPSVKGDRLFVNNGYPCSWAGQHDLVKGGTAYKHGDYAQSVSLWQAAAAKSCPVAAYRLSLMYLQGKHVPVNHALGTAWMSVAANSRYTLTNYAGVRNLLMQHLTASDQAQAHADYARLRTSLKLPVPAVAAN